MFDSDEYILDVVYHVDLNFAMAIEFVRAKVLLNYQVDMMNHS